MFVGGIDCNINHSHVPQNNISINMDGCDIRECLNLIWQGVTVKKKNNMMNKTPADIHAPKP